jgi:3' terminal RNA ribose 2'-O-methyltransferase Hen1
MRNRICSATVILTISTTHRPATDLGYLLHKNPANPQRFEVSFGAVQVVFPEADEERCTCALLLDVDPVGLVRGRGRGEGGLEQYVNDRPYVASSFLSVAISRVLGSALGGRSKERPELAETAIPLRVELSVVPCRGAVAGVGAGGGRETGEAFLHGLFEPLGYAVEAERLTLDDRFPEWGQSPYYRLSLSRTCRLQELLVHLYVLIPVLDNEKHYWVGDDEVEKLLRAGEGWLAGHPLREAIVSRSLKHRRPLANEAMERLREESEPNLDAADEEHAAEEEAVERPLSLNQQRIGAVLSALRASGAQRVLDLGCGEGSLLRELICEPSIGELVGMDVSHRSLERASERLRLDRMPEKQRQRIKLIHGSLMYRDKRLEGFDAAAVVEVIEHLDPPRLAAFERVLFEFARPKTVVLTTPNREYNVMWETLPAGEMRHRDHRFEWTREEFKAWAGRIAGRFGYSVRFLPVGPVDEGVGSPTQMGVFERAEG